MRPATLRNTRVLGVRNITGATRGQMNVGTRLDVVCTEEILHFLSFT